MNPFLGEMNTIALCLKFGSSVELRERFQWSVSILTTPEWTLVLVLKAWKAHCFSLRIPCFELVKHWDAPFCAMLSGVLAKKKKKKK